ncbi:hypothetical protein [Exiguobacterium mexicanum]
MNTVTAMKARTNFSVAHVHVAVFLSGSELPCCSVDSSARTALSV